MPVSVSGAAYRKSVARRISAWLAAHHLCIAASLAWTGVSAHAFGAAPLVLHMIGYQGPVHGAAGDVMVIIGDGFSATDRLVYHAITSPEEINAHPSRVPLQSTAFAGTAEVLLVGSRGDSLMIRLPMVVSSGRSYGLWVVDELGDWSTGMPINDPRPSWVTPGFVYATADYAGLGRHIRVVGRNLAPGGRPSPLLVRLQGPGTYTLATQAPSGKPRGTEDYVVDVALPRELRPGSYSIGVSWDGLSWARLSTQQLEVRPDPPALPRFRLDEPRFGGCRPDDERDDTECLGLAVASAHQAGGGIVVIPPGTWDVEAARPIALPPDVHLLGSGDHPGSRLVRHDAAETRPEAAFLLLGGHNSVVGITFSDAGDYETGDQSRAFIRLQNSGTPQSPVSDVIISGNDFHHVGRAVADSGQPISRLFITHNEFAAYDVALALPGNRYAVTTPYEIQDSVVRWNRFVPGSYVDLPHHQGTLASELGASLRVDFSTNTADGASTAGLQNPKDPPGWRAAYFWNMNNSHEYLLVSDNRITCPGDKLGDGEAIAFDGNGDTFGFNGAAPVVAATADTVVVSGSLLSRQNDRGIDTATYYAGHWVQVVQGRGAGQSRKITGYTQDPGAGTVAFRVMPRWDVVPQPTDSRVIVGRQFWQVFAVANTVDQGRPLCRKSNLSGPYGGGINMWAASSDSVVAGNSQRDTSGIAFQQTYSVPDSSCRDCGNSSAVQFGLEISGNVVDGEYDWSSDCSSSGITGSFGAAPTPGSPPPTLGFGIAITRNFISHADGLHGGAIDIASTWFRGPPPYDWPLVRNLVIFGNKVRDVSGSLPRSVCGYPQRTRTGIRLDGPDNVRDVVIYGNQCPNVDALIDDPDPRHARLCSAQASDGCECGAPRSGPSH